VQGLQLHLKTRRDTTEEECSDGDASPRDATEQDCGDGYACEEERHEPENGESTGHVGEFGEENPRSQQERTF